MADTALEQIWSSAAPMLASGPPDPLVVPSGAQWSFEVKWDGVRALARIDVGGGVRLRSRTGADVSARYPAAVAPAVGTALAEVLAPAILDGECVAFDDRGHPSFPGALRGGRGARFVCFDVLMARGRDVRALPLHDRREVLAEVGIGSRTADAWRSSPAFDDGPALLAATAEQGLEGVMAKDLRSPYRSGARSEAWVKLPHRTTGPVVVVGWLSTGPQIGSLVVADAQRRLVGAVGSGLSPRIGAALAPVLRSIERPDPDPALDLADRGEWLRARRDRLHWVVPALVSDVRHLGHTESGSLRQPVLVRMRPDLTAPDVVGAPW